MNFYEERPLASGAHEAIVDMRRRRRWIITFRLSWGLYYLLISLMMFGIIN